MTPTDREALNLSLSSLVKRMSDDEATEVEALVMAIITDRDLSNNPLTFSRNENETSMDANRRKQRKR